MNFNIQIQIGYFKSKIKKYIYAGKTGQLNEIQKGTMYNAKSKEEREDWSVYTEEVISRWGTGVVEQS